MLVESKPVAEECFEEQDPIIKLPSLAPCNAWTLSPSSANGYSWNIRRSSYYKWTTASFLTVDFEQLSRHQNQHSGSEKVKDSQLSNGDLSRENWWHSNRASAPEEETDLV